jgi:ABC-2 type transport system permease protein
MRNSLFAIVKQELAKRRFYLLWWSLGIIVLVALTVLAYGTIKNEAGQLNQAFGHLSSNISGFVGTSDMFSPVGYLNSQLFFITLPILFIILSVTLASSLVNKEEQRHTLELLLSRPVGRSRLLWAKGLAGVTVVGLLGIVTAVVTILCGLAVHIGVSAGYITLATLMMVLFSGAFGAIAFMLYAASLLTRRVAATIAIVLSFGGYILSSLGGMVHGLAWSAKLFPYHYYDPGAMLQSGKVSHGLLIYLGGLYILSIIIAIIGFRRRDIA